MNTQKPLGDKIYAMRIAANETQEQLAEAVGTSHVSITRYESGQRVPKITILQKIAQHYNVSLDDLLERDSKPEDLTADISGIDFALYGEIHDATEKEKADLLDYMRFLKSKRGRK